MRINITTYLFISFLFGLSFTSYGQMDSLQRALESSEDPIERVSILNSLAWEIRRFDLSKSDSMAQIALKEAKEQNLLNEQAIAINTLAVIDIMSGNYSGAVQKLKQASSINLNQKAFKGYLDNEMNIGLVYYFKGQLDSAAAILLVVAEKADSLKVPSTAAKILSNLGAIYQSQGQYQNAIEVSLRCLDQAEALDDMELFSATCGNIGLLYDYIKNFEKSIQYQRKSIELDSTNGDLSGLGYSYGNLGEVYRQMGDWDKAKSSYERSLKFNSEVGDSGAIAGQLMNLGLYYEQANQLDSAELSISKGLDISTRNNYPYQVALGYSQLGMISKARGNWETAIEKLSLALTMSLEQEIADLIIGCYTGLSECYAEYGRPDSAYKYLKLSTELSDSLMASETKQTIENLETQYRTAEKEKEIAQLSKAQTQASLDIAQQRIWILALIAGLLLSAGGGGFLVYRRRRVAQAQLAAQQLAFQKNILDSTVEAQENERQRIAKDLHDGLVQTLAALKLGVQNALNSSVTERNQQFQEHINQIDQAAEEARNISHQMMPRTLLEAGMIPAIDEMLGKTLGQTNITFRFDHYALEGQRFPKNIEISLYRISQELVNNIMKHSGATEVDVQIYKTKTHLILHVEDNGKGMNSAQEGGLGLNNIYSRASSVNGEVQYEKGQTTGTVANVRIPI